MNTYKGLYKYNRLQFGLKVTPTIFQQVMHAMLVDWEFVIPYWDDILIKSESHHQHIKHAKCVFEKVRNYGFTLSDKLSTKMDDHQTGWGQMQLNICLFQLIQWPFLNLRIIFKIIYQICMN